MECSSDSGGCHSLATLIPGRPPSIRTIGNNRKYGNGVGTQEVTNILQLASILSARVHRCYPTIARTKGRAFWHGNYNDRKHSHPQHRRKQNRPSRYVDRDSSVLHVGLSN